MERRRKTNKERIPEYAGYRGFGGDIYCSKCLVEDDYNVLEHLQVAHLLNHDRTKPIRKAEAYKENLICSNCEKPLITKKYKEFQERVKGKGRVLKRGRGRKKRF